MKNEFIVPECCDKAKTTNVVRLGLYENPDELVVYDEKKDRYINNYGKIKPVWYILGTTISMNTPFTFKVKVDKCPFCQTDLPEIEKSDKKRRCSASDGDYCLTCKQRVFVCNCYPPEFRWQIKK